MLRITHTMHSPSCVLLCLMIDVCCNHLAAALLLLLLLLLVWCVPLCQHQLRR